MWQQMSGLESANDVKSGDRQSCGADPDMKAAVVVVVPQLSDMGQGDGAG